MSSHARKRGRVGWKADMDTRSTRRAPRHALKADVVVTDWHSAPEDQKLLEAWLADLAVPQSVP